VLSVAQVVAAAMPPLDPALIGFDEKATKEKIDAITKEFEVNDKELDSLSNKFFNAIPRGEFARHAIRGIKDANTIKNELNTMTQLLELQIAIRIVLGAQLRAAAINPLDYCYGALGVHLRPLSRKSDEYKLLVEYASRSMDSGRIVNIYALKRKGEEERYAPYESFSNRMLLWHGSGLVNWSGILSQGLRIAPPEADPSGYMFGKGVYFADCFRKSYGYCRPASGFNQWGGGDQMPRFSLMLLCEVALGTMKGFLDATYMESAAPGSHSTKGLGSQGPDFAQCRTTVDGVVIPCGPLVSYPPPPFDPLRIHHRTSYGLNYNEYIVYNEGQVKMRYLLQVAS